MSFLYTYLKDYWKLVLLALVLAAINQVFSLLDPLVFRHVIDKYATRYKDYTTGQFVNGVIGLLALAVGVAFVSRVAKNFQDYFINVIIQRLGTRVYADGIAHSLELPYSVFEDQRSGETLGVLQKVRTDIERFVSASINVVFTTLVGLVFVIIYSFSLHWAIVPIFIITGPAIGVLSSILSKKIKKLQKAIVAETTALAGTTTESLRNIELVKSMGLAGQEIRRLNSANEKILALELKKVRFIRSLSFIQGTTVNFLRTSILFVMLYLIFSRTITVGEFFSLWIYSFFIFGPLQEIGSIINIYRETEVSLANFKKIMQMPREPAPENPVQIERVEELSFDDVHFRHQSAERNALSGISFEAARGKTIAFVGPSGSGKSTLVKLLLGLYRPQSGTISYNGVTHEHIDIGVIREKIGFVAQDTQLFSGTIRENLLFVKPAATDDDCLRVMRMAACNSLLNRAESGLDTVIGEGGIKVSGGEKQRLSIARALLRNPELLIFDEATSSLDSITEEEISDTIRELSKRRETISILIAHRLSTVMHADMIYVLEQGRIVESGLHDELVDARGLYYAMWRQQAGRIRQDSADAQARAVSAVTT